MTFNEDEHTEHEDKRVCDSEDSVPPRAKHEGKGFAASRIANIVQYGGAIVVWVVLWAAIALLVGNPILVAGPGETIVAFFGSFTQPAFWSAVCQTTVRIVCVGLASALLATVLGFAAARFSWVRVLLAPAIQVMKSAPVACIIVIVLVAAGAAGALVSIVAFVTIPPFYVAALEAQQARNHATERVLRLAGLSKPRIFLASTWPSMLPYFSAAAKTAIGLSWKAGITAELLCIPLGSIGAAVYGAKLTLDTPVLLMWTIVVMLLGWMNEKIAVALLNVTRKSPIWAIRSRRAKSAPRTQGAADSHNILSVQRSAATTCQTQNAQGAMNPHGTPAPAIALALDRVRFGYDDRFVLDDLSLRVDEGERICLMAPTGTGKTTLISLLTAQYESRTGSTVSPDRMGLVLQQGTLIDSLSALQNVLLACENTDATSQIKHELETLLPEGSIHKPASELSGGTRRLTEIARALLGAGEAIILDEPFTGLDANANDRACAFILKHLDDRPLLFTTHHAEDATRLNAQVIVLENGRATSSSR